MEYRPRGPRGVGGGARDGLRERLRTGGKVKVRTVYLVRKERVGKGWSRLRRLVQEQDLYKDHQNDSSHWNDMLRFSKQEHICCVPDLS